MRRRPSPRWAGLVSLALLAASPSPRPSPTPVALELHRTAQAAFVGPARANPLFVLVIGSDVREGDPARGRADSLHVVAVNTATGRGTIVGIPRDAYLPIPGRGTAKVNEALRLGGPEKVVQVLSAVSGIGFHYWALIEFSRFRKLVDALGGVEVDVPYRMADKDSGAFFAPGRQHMNGDQLLAFARDRHDVPGGDFGRSENQGRILLAGLAKLRQEANDPFRLLQWLQAFRQYVATDVPLRDLLVLGTIGRRLDPAAFRNVVLPGRPGTAGGASVVFLDPGGTNAIFSAIRDDGVL